MARTIAIISCLLAALFLIPVSGDCCNIYEPEAETEAVGECAVVCIEISETPTVVSDSRQRCQAEAELPPTHCADGYMVVRRALPSRIIHCVFRE